MATIYSYYVLSGTNNYYGGDARTEVDYEYSTNYAGNYTDITANQYLRVSGFSTIEGSGKFTLTVAGVSVVTTGVSLMNQSAQRRWIQSNTQRVYHNTSTGDAGAYVQGWLLATGYEWSSNKGTNNKWVAFPNIPQGTTINTFGLSEATFTTAKVTWATAHNVNRVQYSVDGGVWTNGWTGNTTSGNFTISGLWHGTAYSIRIKVRREGNNNETTSGAKSITTTQIATLTSVPDNIDIDTPFSITIARNGATTVQVGILDADGTTIRGAYKTITGTSDTFTLTTGEKDDIFSNMSTVKTKVFRVYVRTNANDSYRDYVNRTFVVNNADPVFTTATQADVNSVTTALTGNSAKWILGYSNVRVTISNTNKATAKKGATMDAYVFTAQGHQSESKAWVTGSSVTKDFNAIQSPTILVTASDSRNNTTTVTINNTANVIAYNKPTISTVSIGREANIYSTVRVSVTGTFSNINFGSQTNTITATYKYKNTSSSNWITGLGTITLTKSGNTFSATNLELRGDLGSSEGYGFTQSSSFDIELTISDKLDTAVFTTVLPSGTPPIAIATNGISMGAPYDEEIGGALQITGNIFFNIDGELVPLLVEDD